MDIHFKDQKLAKICNNERALVRKYGPERAKLLRLRLRQFKAAENLDALRSLPQVRCHELKGNRAGTLAVDVGHPYRLIFEPASNPVPIKLDGGLDWICVTAVRVLAVEDYHG